MIIYLDSEYRCHVQNDGTMRTFEVPEFDGMCDSYIEGYRYIPTGETWMREDGIEFTGEMLAPYDDYVELQAQQLQHEQEMRAKMRANSVPIADLEAAYQEGVNSAYES